MRIAMLLSGGVDSSVALARLVEQRHEVTAFYLKIWLEDELSFLGSCPWEEDLSYVRAVCKQLNVPLTVVSFQREYHERVVANMIEQLRRGRTPNPDMLCNREVKFGAFLDRYGRKFDAVASGHYAQVQTDEHGVAHLRCAPDPVKDQTYFLAMMTQAQLRQAMFPIGDMDKAQVRVEAAKRNLPTATRKDSQGICFLGKISFREFVLRHCGERPGAVVEYGTQRVIGTHRGYYLYTIGQRKGLNLPGGPWYVCNKDAERNIVYVAHGFAQHDQWRDTLIVEGCNWIVEPPHSGEMLRVKLRHGTVSYGARITSDTDASYRVVLEKKDQGITPGQYAVFYRGNECLGGGIISERTHKDDGMGTMY